MRPVVRPVTAPTTQPGRYVGHGEPFTLERVEGGWRRVFDPRGGWTWTDGATWSDDEVARKVRLGVWRRVKGSGENVSR